MKIDSTLGLDQKAQVLLTILATKNDQEPFPSGMHLHTRAYYEGNRGWVVIQLEYKGFVKQLTFGKDRNSDQFLIQTWEVSVDNPAEEDATPVLFQEVRIYEAVEFILRELREARVLMQGNPPPTRLQRVLAGD